MTTLLRYVEFLSLGTWIGGIVFLSFVVAPGAFRTLGSRDAAGAIVSMALGRLHQLGFFAGVLFLGSRAARTWLAQRSPSGLVSAPVLVVVAMLVLTMIAQHGVGARLAELRVEMGSVERTAADHPLRLQFNRLHRVSVQLEGAVLLLGLGALFLVVRERPL